MSDPATASGRPSLEGLRVVSFESRRAGDMQRLLAKSGGSVLVAPSMREVPLSAESGAIAFGRALLGASVDGLILLTGVGCRILVDAMAEALGREAVIAALADTPLLCRGPKPAAVLKQLGLTATVTAPEPNTWRELLETLDARWPPAGKRVFVQEYGAANHQLLEALRARGAAAVERVQVYRWALPTDTAPLEAALRAIAEGEADAALFTSAHQVSNILSLADTLGIRDRVVQALERRVAVASVGPVTSEALVEHGLRVDIEPQSPKIGPLAVALARQARATIERKRRE